jgi:hypothetical protein
MQVAPKSGPGAAKTQAGAPTKIRSADPGTEPAIDGAIIAVIALALELESQPEASRIEIQRGTSFWALSGRARVLRGR